MERAFQLQATDIHLDPLEDGLRLRLRVDGMLHDIIQLPKEAAASVISRLKLAANMDITERRLAQDGHINNQTLQNRRDIRVGSGPTIHGERLVLRLMPDHKRFTHFNELGLSEAQTSEITKYCTAPYGMILSVGPVGSGKSTSIYSCLDYLNQPEMSLATIEDPVERRIEGVNQIQIDPKIGFSFAEALRGVLRQDPNVIMVGEIRDRETAETVFQASLSGHLVITTFHAGSATEAVSRLSDMGIEPYLLRSGLLAILSQRLLRRLCSCAQPSQAEEDRLGLPVEQWKTATGCADCGQTGYQGRLDLTEMLLPDQGAVCQAILDQVDATELHRLAVESGLRTQWNRALRAVNEGLTSPAEVRRVLGISRSET
jgi:type II secretory ATPase GspE/PulE/Tfp pilus assembly ATPase PilB-like protein